MALKGSTATGIPVRHQEIDEIEIPYIGSNVYATLQTGENNAQTYDNASVSNKRTNGLAGLSRGNPTLTDGTKPRYTITVLAIGLLLFTTLIAIASGIIGYHLNDSCNEIATEQPFEKDNNISSSDGWSKSADDFVETQLTRLNDEWEKRVNAITNNHSEALGYLRELFLLVNASHTAEGNQHNTTCTRCPPGWVTSETSCYLFVRNHQSTCTEAEHYCRQQNDSHLVEVETEAENLFLRDYMRGLTGWNTGEPDSQSGEEDCVMFHKDELYRWADFPCTWKYNPVCELRQSP